MKHTRKNKPRRPYRKSRAADPSCRSGGSCEWCRGNRLHKHKRQIEP